MNVNNFNPSFSGWIKPVNNKSNKEMLNTDNIVTMRQESSPNGVYTVVTTNEPKNNEKTFNCNTITLIDAIKASEKNNIGASTFECRG